MRDAKGLNLKQCLPRMTWHYRNLFNLYRRSLQEPEKIRPPYGESRMVTFKQTRSSLFQQRWKSKALVRGYHGDHINEKIFKRWYLPDTLPDVRPRQVILRPDDDKIQLEIFRQRKNEVARREARRLEEEERRGMAPVGSLMFSEVERRIDVFLFRACFAHSVYEARRLVIHGNVMLNGKKHSNANTRLAPGDLVSVDPSAIRMLQQYQLEKSEADTSEDSKTTLAAEETTESELAADNTPGSEATAEADASTSTKSTHSNSRSAPPKPIAPHQGELGKYLASKPSLTPFTLPPYASPFLFIPAYIEPSFSTCSAIYVRHPTARPGYSEIPTPFEADGEIVRLAWEWYAKCRPRMRSAKQVARMPENRRSVAEIKAGLVSGGKGRERPPHVVRLGR